MSSVLVSIETPQAAFDALGQLVSSTSHTHLVDSHFSLSTSFSPSHRPRLPRPPNTPYQPSAVHGLEKGGGRRKRRRLAPPAEEATPADWRAKRLKDENLTTTDVETQQHHDAIAAELHGALALIQEASHLPLESAMTISWINPEDEDDARQEVDWVNEAAVSGPRDQQAAVLQVSDEFVSLGEPFDRITHNGSRRPRLLSIASLSVPHVSILLPPNSAFLLSDFSTWSSPESGIAAFGADVGGWDALILDPPWPNKSATRSSSYETWDAYDLWKLNVPALLGSAKPTLVAVWVTNKVKFRRLLLDKLFPAWGIEQPVEWYWLKVTTSCEPVFPLESTHRRAYEGLILGYHNPTRSILPTLPKSNIFLSTPLGHSRKPVLLDLLRPFLPCIASTPPRAPNVLELFARTALAGPTDRVDSESREEDDGAHDREGRGVWLSVGNEAIKFNVVHEPAREGAGKRVKGWLVAGDT